ncbi:MAG: substrate-binding domain-containing protein [Acidobacteria bacterium]|nr:substrate-binding domain-containing protein [Acidobacteriota bacterium]
MAVPRSGNKQYLCEAVLRACDILEAFRSESELLRLSEIAARTGLSRPTALRLIYSLETRGLLQREGKSRYRLAIRPLRKRAYRIGYGSHSAEFAFSRAVQESLIAAARQENIELLVLDNQYSPKIAIRNADTFIHERMDLVVEFQADEHVAAPVIASKMQEAGIPLIAVEIPHPGATYYGANNYQAGLLGGRFLGRWARQHWGGEVDKLILLELPMSGPIPAARLGGTLTGLREVLPQLPESSVVHLDGKGRFGPSMEIMRRHLSFDRSRRVLISAINDPSIIGAIRAFEETGRAAHCAAVGHNASSEARVELRRPDTRLIGSVGYFPESYGPGVISLALDILHKAPAPPAVFTRHQLVTPANVNHLYPNDPIVLPSDLDARLLRSH